MRVLAFPLVLAGSQVTHDLTYRLLYPVHATRAQALTATGHGYLHDASFGIVVGLAAVLAGLVFRIVEVRRDSDAAVVRVPPAPFALLPIAIFVVQENLERVVHGGGAPFAAVLEPTFRVGIVLQLPVALVAYLLTRALLGAADRIGAALRRIPPRSLVSCAGSDPRPVRIALARPAGVLALGRAGRAPPGLASV